MPVLPSAFARPMSAVVRTFRIMSSCSRNQAFQRAMFFIVSAKPSQMQHVQLAAVRPPRRMSSNTSRLQLETTSPSNTTAP